MGESYLFVAFEPSPRIGGSGNFFPLSQLSDGTRRALRAVTALLFDKRSLMLMEQPEDSMHPGLLEKLIDVFRSYSSRSQIVFTTHSPDVLDLLEPDELILVTAPNGRTQARHLSTDETVRAKQYLKDKGSLSEFVELAGEE